MIFVNQFRKLKYQLIWSPFAKINKSLVGHLSFFTTKMFFFYEIKVLNEYGFPKKKPEDWERSLIWVVFESNSMQNANEMKSNKQNSCKWITNSRLFCFQNIWFKLNKFQLKLNWMAEFSHWNCLLKRYRFWIWSRKILPRCFSEQSH